MNLSAKRASVGDEKLSSAKATLNPNAAAFVPSALRSQAAGISIADASSKFATSTAAIPKKSILDRSESSISNNSNEEAHQYWHHQLPDDITPDFKVMGIDDTQGINSLSFSGLSLTDVNQGSRYTSSTSSGNMLKEEQSLSPYHLNGNGHAEKLRYPLSSYGEYPSPTGFQSSLAKPDRQVVSNDQLLARQGHPYTVNSRNGFLADISNEQLLVDNEDVGPLEFLASQFPGFAAESLAEVYLANGGDLNLTIEMLSHLELQFDGGLNQTLNSKALSTPNLSALNFAALSVTDCQNGLTKFVGAVNQSISPYQSSEKDRALLLRYSTSIPSRGATDFASSVRKMASQDPSIWKYDRNGSSDSSIGSTRSSQVQASSYGSGHGRGLYGDRLQNRGSSHASPLWLETGDAVDIYSEMREEAPDRSYTRNAYFEQGRHAYLIGNKTIAKELSLNGQLHNIQMQAAHGIAQESIYRQRKLEMQGNWRELMIDLHGLHVSEAIHVLKGEVDILRHAARSADQRLVAYIRVGAGADTRGPCSPGRLPAAVQHYLLEEEGLDYTEPQAGILRVVIY